MAESRTAAFRTALTVALLGAAVAAAGSSAAKQVVEGVRCYGIAKAGENDCRNATGTHDCAGKATVDYSGAEWRDIPDKQECMLRGGALRPFMGVNSKMKERS